MARWDPPKARGPALEIEGERGDASQDLERVKVERVAGGRAAPLGHAGPANSRARGRERARGRAGLISFDRRRIVIRDGVHLAARAAAT